MFVLIPQKQLNKPVDNYFFFAKLSLLYNYYISKYLIIKSIYIY